MTAVQRLAPIAAGVRAPQAQSPVGGTSIYRSSKTYGHAEGLSCCFRQWRAVSSHCHLLHGYALAFHFVFATDQLDERNWCFDFGGLKPVRAWLHEMFDHTVLVAEDDPERAEFERLAGRGLVDLRIVPAVGCEAVARHVFEHVAAFVAAFVAEQTGGRVWLEVVEVREHSGNSASYQSPNRFNLLRVGEAAEFIQSRPELLATVAQLERTLQALPKLIDALPSPEAAAALRAQLDPLVPRMLQLAAASNTRSGELVAADQHELSDLHWTLAKLMFALILCAAGLVCMIQVIAARMVSNLQYTKEVAGAANAAKSQFLANVSHELRTPLNGLLGAIELLMASDPTAQQRRYAETAQMAGRILFEMIAEILHFAKIESGQIELDMQPVDVAAVVIEVADIVRPQVLEKSLEMSVRVEPGFPAAVLADAGRLRQVLMNLAGNAVKFTSVGTIEVTLAADAPVAGQCELRICVADTGIGIPADKIERIFDPFIQADLSTTRRYGGVGLGLAIVKNLVKRMGGRIEVQSREGEGARFIVSLKLAIAERPQAACLAAPPTAADALARRTVTPRVLLVDDTGTSREVVHALLQRAGCTVDLAENGLEAVQRCAAGTYDIIFMDRHMPVMDGIEATQRIRAQVQSGNSRCLIVGLSAGALEEERESCLAAGMDDYLTKPIRMARIVAKVDTWRDSVAAAA